jgi:ankyrin repeat protein
VEQLLESGANLDVRNKKPETPLHLACFNGKLDVSRFLVKLFLERGADRHATNGEGQTPYEASLAFGFREVADLLRAHGASSERFDEIL